MICRMTVNLEVVSENTVMVREYEKMKRRHRTLYLLVEVSGVHSKHASGHASCTIVPLISSSHHSFLRVVALVNWVIHEQVLVVVVLLDSSEYVPKVKSRSFSHPSPRETMMKKT